MNTKLAILLVLVLGIILVGCQSKDYTGNYAAYNQPQGQQQGQYVGGGCGVAPSGDIAETPVGELSQGASGL